MASPVPVALPGLDLGKQRPAFRAVCPESSGANDLL